LSEIIEMVVKSTAEKTGSNRVAKFSALFCLEFKICFVGAKVHRLAATGKLEGPRSCFHSSLEFELTGESRSN
jgi:hypothetical protein